jgi:DNA-binding transcriptional MerR regulator
MHCKEIFSVSDFAKIARTTKPTLHHYDKIGLLSPALRGKNGYRYYSIEQLAVLNLIRTCQESGMSLDEIKELADHRTPALVDELLVRQISRINDKINEWVRARTLLTVLQESIHSVRDVDMDAITVNSLPAKTIILGKLNDYSQGKNDYDALFDFYLYFSENYPDLNLNYPVWGIFSEYKVRNGDMALPDRYYFNNPEGFDRIPAALYATGYCYGGYGRAGVSNLYIRIMAFLDANGYTVSGPAYVEYPLNEICVSTPSDYLIRMLFTVRKLGSREYPKAFAG